MIIDLHITTYKSHGQDEIGTADTLVPYWFPTWPHIHHTFRITVFTARIISFRCMFCHFRVAGYALHVSWIILCKLFCDFLLFVQIHDKSSHALCICLHSHVTMYRNPLYMSRSMFVIQSGPVGLALHFPFENTWAKLSERPPRAGCCKEARCSLPFSISLQCYYCETTTLLLCPRFSFPLSIPPLPHLLLLLFFLLHCIYQKVLI